MRVSGRKRICPSCGRKLVTSTLHECPSCGELISRRAKKCPVCHADLPGVASKTKAKTSEMIAEVPVPAIKETDSIQVKEEMRQSCPECGTPLDGTESKCPKCGHELKSDLVRRCTICGAHHEEGLIECPNCGIPLAGVGVAAKTAIPTDSISVGKPSHAVSVRRLANSRPCPSCGAIIPKSFQECPLCKTSFVEMKPQEEAHGLSAESSKIERPEVSPIAAVKVDSTEIRHAKLRKLKTEKVTTVPATAQTSAHGLTNGVGQVNGLGKVNGTGMASGGAYVNGTGVSSGLGAESKKRSAKHTSNIIRWQFLAVLIAIIIVISTFVFLSYSQEKSSVSVDGKFGDWGSVQKFGMYTTAGSAPINVDEWAVSHQSDKVFVYVKVQADMMRSVNVSSFYLFIDNDNSPSTGYSVSWIGADYLVELDGWNGSVRSSSVSKYGSGTDHLDWNSWVRVGSASASVSGTQLEASAELPEALSPNAKLLLLSKDNLDRNALSYPMPQKGGLLIIKQEAGTGIQADGIVPSASSVAILKLTLSCEGAGGTVDDIVPSVTGATLSFDFQRVSLSSGGSRVINISVDTSSSAPGTFAEALVSASNVNSSFAGVNVVGLPARAYVKSAPAAIHIDGAFADWTGKVTTDSDPVPVGDKNIDMNAVGAVNSTASSSFYVSVLGEMLGGSQVPVSASKPSTGGGGAIVIPTKKTGEDVLRIYVDSDLSSATGYLKMVAPKTVGADYLIEVKGIDEVARSGTLYSYSSGQWSAVSGAFVLAENDRQQIELSVSSSSISGSSSIDFIVETTDWRARSDLATSVPTPGKSLSRFTAGSPGIDAWIVDGTKSSAATAMSYQRKLFDDGINFWSFFYNGTNTVHKYSVDGGQTWTNSGSVFRTAGVNETSIWHDSSTGTVYAVGDTSTATNRVYVQVGTVDAAAHSISWATIDYGPKTSAVALGGKNTYICKDTNGYLWVLSSNCTALGAYQLSAFRSSAVNNASSWVFTGQMLTASSTLDNVKGSIVPAGLGSNVWAIYAYNGNVGARKYTVSWSAQSTIFPTTGGSSRANTDNSPPSVVVDGKGVVHVVFGNGYRWAGISIPRTLYSHNNTGLTTFSPNLDLDPLEPLNVGNYYPTISLDASTNDLHVFWLRSVSTTTFAPITVMGSKCVSGTWSYITIDQQTNFTKQYLTSIYSVSSEDKICWQWTQNLTAPIEVLYDNIPIPEFSHLAMPIIGSIAIFAVYRQRSRDKQNRHRRQAQD
jgi:predicted RNA-binding Zn-ribbon protein involved in translation (DUF1610 family)